MAAAFGVVLALLALVVGVGVRASSVAATDAAKLAEAVTLINDVGQLRYRAADFNGWQTAYALDVARKSPKAVDDTAGGSRTLFLKSAQAFSQELALVGDHRLSQTQRAMLGKTSAAFQQFMELDADIVTLYRKGGPADLARGDELVLGDAITLFDAVAAGAAELNTSVEKDSNAAAAHAAADSRTAKRLQLAVGLAALALGALLTLLLTRSIVAPLRQVSNALVGMANGDLTGQAQVQGRDEVAQMARSLTQAQQSMRGAIQAMACNATTLAAAAQELSANTDQISTTAQDTAAQATALSHSAEQVSNNVQTVAAGAEQMGASIREIATNASEASRVAAGAVEVAASTTSTVGELGESSNLISQVVKTITSIAEQTNLLALNATIEAARAGEAGKGFAVVANEVKELAQETAKATEDIGRRIAAIQAGTTKAVSAIEDISEVIGQINGYQSTIAVAVEEQTATTNEMSRSITEAATGSSAIAENITGLADAAATTTSGVDQAQQATAELARMSSELQLVVNGFRY